MHRRQFLKATGTAAFGLALGGCALRGSPPPRRPMAALYPVEVSWDRIIRTTVGLRPNRAAGFRVEAERFDHKTVVHNYGHGGAGMSLSWGTGQLAAEQALHHSERRVAVIGSGIVGLTAARQLQRRGFDVTIYAKDLPPHTTSNKSWAGFTPTSGLGDASQFTPAWERQFRRAIEIAYHEHQLLVGRGYGVSWIYTYSPTDTAPPAGGGEGGGLLPSTVDVGGVLLEEGEHAFETRYARRRPRMRFEPSIYLDALMRDVRLYGGDIAIRSFESPRDFMELPEELIVNCTGLGSKALLGDDTMTPVRGQLVVLLPQPEVNYAMGAMMPRSDGIVLGHTNERGVWDLEVDEEAQARVMENAMRTFSALRVPEAPVPPLQVSQALEPPPVESFFGLES